MKYISIIVYLLLSLLATGYAQDIRFRKITSNQGISHNTVYAIAQDEKGCMWFGTREGLNRFDSYNIKNYYIDNSRLGGSANKISSLLYFNNKVYVGTDNGLYEYNSQSDELKESRIFPHKQAVLFLYKLSVAVYIGTTSGLYKLKEDKAQLISTPRIAARAMCQISNDRYLFAFNKSLSIINSKGEVLKIFSQTALPSLLKSDFTVFSIYKDHQGMVWVSTNDGLFNYNTENQRFSKVKFSDSETRETNTVRSVIRNKENLLFIGTEEGLYTYDIMSGSSINYQQSFNNDPKRLNDKAIYSTFIAKDGSVWMGTYFGGVNYIPASTFGFKSLMATDNSSGLNGKAISQMMEDDNHRIWIGTEDGGITIYNPGSDSYSYINKATKPFFLTINNVHAIHDDGYGNVWVGTFLGGLHQFDIRKNKTTVYSNKPEDPLSLSNDQVYAIYRDSRGSLWVATQSGLNLFDYKTKSFSLFMPKELGDKFIYDLTEDKNGDIWVCTRNDGIYRFQPEKGNLTNYTAYGNDSKIPSNQVISVYKDSKQNLWFGTLDGGLCSYDIDKGKFLTYTIKDGLPNNNVYGVLEDEKGYIWVTTNRGISRFDVTSRKFTNFDNKYGLPSNQFNFKSYLKSKQGILYFGSINGLCFFNPEAIATDRSLLPLMFTEFELFNKSVVPGKTSILSNQIDYTDEIELAHNQNVFTLNYAAINYSNPGTTNYAYYLEGFENKWNYVGNKKSVTYTNLSAGSYRFHVKAVDATGIDLSQERILKINVTPPFYLSRLAYFFYFLFFAIAIWFYYLFVKFLHQKKLEIQLERVEKEKIRELTQHRLNFFTFISHEFKTPLTLILASIDKFTEEKGAEFKKNPELSNVKSNASILFRLIQQLMEFRKIETDHDDINLSKLNIVGFIKEAVLSFKTISSKKNIELIFSTSDPIVECYFDKDKVEKILLNILSNAVKNTSEGKIEIRLDFKSQENGNRVINITVSDTGRGMTSKELKNIFNPFYKVSENDEGNGIGMALVDSLVKYLNGQIKIQSQLKKGTVIEVELPLLLQLDDRSLLKEPEKLKDHNITSLNDNAVPQEVRSIETKVKYTLMIVEDNKELLTFLSTHFSKSYNIVTAGNGYIALKKIHKMPPDIIISDVKMPRMDGFELCSKIKNDNRFNYIPVILLSDSNTENIKIDGLDIGADAYLSKPFNLKEFELLITNMIGSRVKLREHVIGIGEFSSENLPSNNKDQEFLSKLSSALEKRFSDPLVTIEILARDLNMSRTSLHLNLKRILNKSATELLNEYRLKRAAIMLENDMPVNEAAYYCGYNDPNYFTRIFKKHFNETPLKYKERNIRRVEGVEGKR